MGRLPGRNAVISLVEIVQGKNTITYMTLLILATAEIGLELFFRELVTLKSSAFFYSRTSHLDNIASNFVP